MQEDADRSLITKISQGDQESFLSLVALYKERALRIAYHHVGSWEDAEEIAQDAFVRVFRNAKTFKGNAKFSTWFYRILVNRCYDQFRKRKIKKAPLRQTDSGEIIDPLMEIPGSDSPERNVLNEEKKRIIDIAVEQLPEQQKTVFILHYFEGNKLTEIAGILKTSEGSVKTNLYRAREKLRDSLKEIKNEQ